MVVDCGGGTVDITVYEMTSDGGKLKELHMATGGPHGSTGVLAYWFTWTIYRSAVASWCFVRAGHTCQSDYNVVGLHGNGHSRTTEELSSKGREG